VLAVRWVPLDIKRREQGAGAGQCTCLLPRLVAGVQTDKTSGKRGLVQTELGVQVCDSISWVSH
jgi:hypothetical protein